MRVDLIGRLARFTERAAVHFRPLWGKVNSREVKECSKKFMFTTSMRKDAGMLGLGLGLAPALRP